MTAKPPASGLDIPAKFVYQALFEHSLHEVHVWELVRDEAGRIVTWRLVDANPRALEIWGRELSEVVGRTTEEIFPGGGAPQAFMPIIEEIFATGRPKEWEVDFLGTGQILHMVSVPLGEYFVSSGFDIAELRSREQELDEAIQSLEQAARAGGVGLWDWDLVTDQVEYSDQWKAQLGYEPHEIEHTFEEWRVRVHPEDLEKTVAVIRHSIETVNQDHETLFRMKHRDGSYRWILAQASFVLDDDGRPVRMLGSHIDITQRRRLEERVLESQKLEAVGTLAAGIAHDFNNLLTVIKGNLSLVCETLSTDAPLQTVLRDVEQATDRAQDLTHQLLTFSTGGAPVLQVASIRKLIEDSARFVTRGSRSRCTFFIEPGLANVAIDVGQMSQVVNNLVINADQAMPEGGTIEIHASNCTLGPGNGEGLEPGSYVKVAVIDEGVGIDDEQASRIFDPFYSTKPGGSGLGLATSYSIVARHGGIMTVDSSLGEGATFELYLPASDQPLATGDATDVVKGSGRILVMDDDHGVGTSIDRMLTWLGYECDLAANDAQAVALYREALGSGRGYDAVILDLTIPGEPGGHHTLGHLKDLDPDVVAIVTSGYAEDSILADFEEHGFQGRLPKPMDVQSLSVEVARVLGAL